MLILVDEDVLFFLVELEPDLLADVDKLLHSYSGGYLVAYNILPFFISHNVFSESIDGHVDILNRTFLLLLLFFLFDKCRLLSSWVSQWWRKINHVDYLFLREQLAIFFLDFPVWLEDPYRLKNGFYSVEWTLPLGFNKCRHLNVLWRMVVRRAEANGLAVPTELSHAVEVLLEVLVRTDVVELVLEVVSEVLLWTDQELGCFDFDEELLQRETVSIANLPITDPTVNPSGVILGWLKI